MMKDVQKTRAQLIEELETLRWQQRALLDSTSDAIITTDLDFIIQGWNPAAETLYGWSAEEAIGRRMEQLVPTEYDDRNDYDARARLQAGGAWSGVVVQTRKDGERIFVQASANSVPDDAGRPTRIVTINRDSTEHKRVEVELTKSEAKFRQLTEKAVVGIYVIQDKKMAYVNPSMAKTLGYEPEEIIGRLTPQDLIHPDDIIIAMKRLTERLTGITENKNYGYRAVKKDGSQIYIEVYSQLTEYLGKPAILGTLIDVTERKRAEQALREMSTIVEKSPAVAFLWRNQAGWPVEYASENVSKLCGHTAEDFNVGRVSYSQVIHPDDLERVRTEVATFSAEEKRTRFKHEPYRIIAKDGSTKWVDNRTVIRRNEAGRITHYRGVVLDITERKHSEELTKLRLRLSEFAAEHSLKELLQETLDEVEKLTGSQMAFYHFMEEDQRTLSLHAWSTRTIREFRTAQEVETHYAVDRAGIWADCVRQRRPVIHNDYAALPHKQGLPEGHAPVIRELVVPISRGDRIVAILGVGNKPSDYTQIDTDLVEHVADFTWEIAARKRAESEREKLRAGLAQSDRLASMGMLASGVAHEINNPLSYVLYNLESLNKDLPRLFERIRSTEAGPDAVDAQGTTAAPDHGSEPTSPVMLDDLAERAREAASGARRIKAISRSLGTFSRVERNELSQVNLHYAIDHAINLAFNEIKYRARLVKDFGRVPTVLANESRLAQVVLNMLINATHAIDEGDVEHNEIRIRTWSEGEDACFEVRDTGQGIPPENLERLFEPFFTTKPVGVGSGLGLSICKNIVNGYGGDITVQSKVGAGTRFTVRLPIRSEEPGPVETRGVAEPEAAPAERGRVLVIDDEAPIRSILERLLGRHHEVVTAESGAAAMQLLEHDRNFDLIICDMMMPAGSGMDLHKWLVDADPDLAKNLLFITGGTFTTKSREYLAQVSNLQIEKPFDVKNFQRLVNKLIVAARAKKDQNA
jgi:PAS domain S-box-containing protein